MKRLSYITIVCAILFTACIPYKHWQVCEYFIERYYNIAEHPTLELTEKDGDMAIKCNLAYDIDKGIGKPYKYDDFERIAEELGDTGYAKVGEKTETGHTENSYVSIYPIISAIDITSNTAWDENHEAGVSLTDCFDISYVSFAEYIDSGYDSKMFKTISERKTKPLSELDPDDLRLVRIIPYVYFVITSLPSDDKNHTLTVLFMLHDGTSRESTIEVEFP